MGVTGRDKTRAFRAEHELVQLAVLAAHAKPAAVILDRNNRATLDEPAEVLDLGVRPHPWKRS